MGAWDIGPFDNDTAADFANDLDDAAEHERIPLLRRALDAVIACDGYLDSDFGVEALAAAAIVARDLPGGQEFTSDAYGPDEPIPPVPADLYPLAVRAMDRILGEVSQIRQLWLEGDETGDGPWPASTRRLRGSHRRRRAGRVGARRVERVEGAARRDRVVAVPHRPEPG